MRRQYGVKTTKRKMLLEGVRVNISPSPMKGQKFLQAMAVLVANGTKTTPSPIFVEVPTVWFDSRKEGDKEEVMRDVMNVLKETLMAMGISTLEINKHWGKIHLSESEPAFTI